MLITNFAAGELAETLFGRTDIPQYFQGVSLLENFDVIPTGGIERRNGMKRICSLEENGRIIPFLIDRQTHFLLFLTPGKIQVYKATAAGVTALPVILMPYTSLKDIYEVQYAQNYDTMILAHRGYAPLIIRYNSGSFSKAVFTASYAVEVVYSSDNITPVPEQDKEVNRDWLNTAGNYPGSVAYMDGRLVFGGIANNPQRLFFSKILGDETKQGVYSFATYKKFVSEEKQFIVVHAELTVGSPDVKLLNTSELTKITEPFTSYTIVSDYFPGGEAEILSLINGNVLHANKNAMNVNPVAQGVIDELDAMIARFNSGNVNPKQYLIAGFRILVGVSYFEIGDNQYFEDVKERYPIPKDAALNVKDDAVWLAGLINNLLASHNISTDWVNYDSIAEIADPWREEILATMQYTYQDIPYYNYPEQIKSEILKTAEGGEAYVALYHVKIIEDRYPSPDDGFTFEIASDMSDAIRWIAQNKHLLIGTETAEWVVPSGVNATNVQAILNSRHGSDALQGTTVGDAVCFFQSGKKGLVEYYIPQQDTNFRANNMAMMSKNMLHESPATDFDFISAPYTKLFICREDGIMVSLLYERATGTFAWSRITTSGYIKSAATLPGNGGYDDVYLVVQRDTDFFLERLEEGKPVYLDSYQEWTGDTAGYAHEAVVYDETDNKRYPTTQAAIPGHVMRIGYPYTSRVRSMPILANDRMKPNNIKSLSIRFNDSFMPRIKSLPNGKEDTIPRKEPYSGIVPVPFPGIYDFDVFFELLHDAPTRCRVLAINAEVQ